MNARIGFWSPLALAATLSLGLAAPAHAVPLATPELSVLGSDTAVCRIVNLGTGPITVKIQLVALGGVAREDTVTVPPGDREALAGDGFSTGGAHCRFIGTFTKANVRGSIDLVDPSFRTLVIAPAQ